MTKADRAAILAFTGGERIRITRNGEVHAYIEPGNIYVYHVNPSNWYFAGFADNILATIAYRAV